MSHTTRSLRAIAPLLAVVLAACGTVTSPASTTPEVVATPVAPSLAALPSAAPTTHPDSDAPDADSWLVVGVTGERGTRVILASTGEILYRLPDGVPNATWGQMLAASVKGTQTMVQDLVVQPGFGGTVEMIDGRWRLPRIGADPTPVGMSADGRTAVLVEDDTATGAERAISRFTVITVPFAAGWSVTAPRTIELPGVFEYDALSPDGSSLYVVEHLAGPPAAHYQVRSVDVGTGRLRPEVVVDKTGDDEAMAGYPIAQLRRADGMVFTLYRGNEHPFIHALGSADNWALCIDLPTSPVTPASSGPDPSVLDWGMASLSDGSLLAVNATQGLAVRVRSDLTVDRVQRFEPVAAGAITLAKFGHNQATSAGRRLVIAPNGTAAYAAGTNGIVRLRPDDLSVLGHLLPGVAVTNLAVTPDRARLFALTADGRILEVDLASGSIVRSVAGGGFDRLFAVVPW